LRCRTFPAPSSAWTGEFPASNSPTIFFRRRAPQARQSARPSYYSVQPAPHIQETDSSGASEVDANCIAVCVGGITADRSARPIDLAEDPGCCYRPKTASPHSGSDATSESLLRRRRCPIPDVFRFLTRPHVHRQSRSRKLALEMLPRLSGRCFRTRSSAISSHSVAAKLSDSSCPHPLKSSDWEDRSRRCGPVKS